MSAAQLARWPAGVALGVAGVWGVRLALGPWPAALVLAPTVLVSVLVGWALVERRMFPAAPPVTPERTRTAPVARLDPVRRAAMIELVDAYTAWRGGQAHASSHRSSRGAA